MYRKKSTLWAILTFIILFSLHLKVFTLSNFDISLSLLLIPIWVFKTYKIEALFYNRIEFVVLIIVVFTPFITIFYVTNWSEFFKTYFQYIISYFLFSRIISKKNKIDFISFRNIIFNFQIFLLCISIIQYVLVVLLGQTSFYNIFGDFQLLYQLPVSEGNVRIKAFYLEPSFLGFVIVNLYWVRLVLEPNKIFNNNFLITILLLLVTKSSFANSAFLLIFGYEFFSSNKLENKKIIKLASIILFLSLIYFSFDLIYSFLRLDEIRSMDEGVTSGYMRVVFPLEVLYNMFFVDGFIFGLPFGSLDTYIQQFFINNYAEKSINNAFFGLICYWGIFAIIFYFYLIAYLIKGKDKLFKSMILLFLINLNNSGAFVTIQFVFIALMLPLTTIQIYKNNLVKLKIWN